MKTYCLEFYKNFTFEFKIFFEAETIEIAIQFTKWLQSKYKEYHIWLT